MTETLAERQARDRELDHRGGDDLEDLGERSVELVVEQLAISIRTEVLDDSFERRMRIR